MIICENTGLSNWGTAMPSEIVRETRRLVSSETRCVVLPESTRDTVETSTPAADATSISVGRESGALRGMGFGAER